MELPIVSIDPVERECIISTLMNSDFIPRFTSDMLLTKEAAWDETDRLEAILFMAGGDKVSEPVHTFTNGLYVRTLFMPAGTLLTSEIHNTQHQFFVQQGLINVWSYESGWRMVQAPYQGITEPGTRRILYVYKDAIWSTVHPNPDNLTDPNEIMRKILTIHRNPYIEEALQL